MTGQKQHLVWIFAGYLGDTLSAATRLDTTAELRKAGWQVTLINMCECDQKEIRGIEVVCLPSPDVYFLRQMIYHLHVLNYILKLKLRPDVILFHQISAMWMLPFVFLRNLRGRRDPLLLMDTRSVFMSGGGMHGWKGWLRSLYIPMMNKVANRWFDGQTAITARMAEAVRIPPERLWGIWPSGVDMELFRNVSRERRWPEDGPVEIIYIGSMEAERNLMNFCLAVEQANKEGMSFHLTLIGGGLQEQELAEFAAQTAGRIRVLPSVPHEDIPAHLAAAHVGVLPFPDEEKFRVSSPVKLFEYMASGLVVLATRISCHTDVVQEGKYVVWAEGYSIPDLIAGLRATWEARASYPQMGAEAILAAAPYTWHESAMKLKAALELGLKRQTECK